MKTKKWFQDGLRWTKSCLIDFQDTDVTSSTLTGCTSLNVYDAEHFAVYGMEENRRRDDEGNIRLIIITFLAATPITLIRGIFRQARQLCNFSSDEQHAFNLRTLQGYSNQRGSPSFHSLESSQQVFIFPLRTLTANDCSSFLLTISPSPLPSE